MSIGGGNGNNGKFKLEIVIPDSFHVSGGPFCCFIKLIPLNDTRDNSNHVLTIDFIAINTYGVLILDSRTKVKSKIQTTLPFPFLREESSKLSQNQDAFLIFSSDYVLFCAGKEINNESKELNCTFTHSSSKSLDHYQCKIPPFIPPSIKGSNVSISYYVYLTVQYRNSLDPRNPCTFSEKLEFLVLGSIYSGMKYYPILPKIGESNLNENFDRNCKSIISKVYGTDNMLFNYESSLTNLLESEEDQSSPKTSNIQLSRDLNTFLILWDSIHELENLDGIASINILYCFNNIVEDFTKLAKTGDIQHMKKLKEWFGSTLNAELYSNDDSIPKHTIHDASDMFLEKLQVKMCCLYNTSLDTMKYLVSRSIKENRRLASEGILVFTIIKMYLEALNFSCEGNKLCVCNISGFSRIEDSKDMDFITNSWFEIKFDFSDSKRHCLKVDISFIRVDIPLDGSPSRHHVIHNQLVTIGKTMSVLTSFIPQDIIPTFNCTFLDVSYKLEITFFCFEDHVNMLERNSIKTGLNKLKLVRWENPIRILQNEALRINAHNHDFKDSKISQNTFSGIKNSCVHFCGKQIPLSRTIEI